MALTPDGLYCPGCGYDLRGLASDRCPECGLAIDTTLSGIIPWERRKSIGYFRSFFRTLTLATFRPTRLALATGSPIDLRSARLFRWIVRMMVIVPTVSLFAFALFLNGGTSALITIGSPVQTSTDPFWEPQFLWTVGATLWPVLPIGFILFAILATGISHWSWVGRLEPVRRNRAMAFTFYLCSPLGWIWIPCLAFTLSAVFSDPQLPTQSSELLAASLRSEGIMSCLMLLPFVVSSVRGVSAATHRGIVRSPVVGAGVIVQAIASFAMGLLLFPMIVGLFRLMITSLWR
jgi:hypothetical protein